MAFHADAQRPPLSLGKLLEPGFSQIQLRQHAIGHGQQVLPGLRQPQAAAFAQPDIGAQLAFELFHTVAQRRLRDAQHIGRCGQRALFFNLLEDGEMDALQHE